MINQRPSTNRTIPSKQTRQAARTWERLQRHPSSDGETYHRLADHFVRQGQLREALAVCRLWIDRCPGDGQGHFDLANLLYAQHQYTDAEQQYQWLVQHYPGLADAHDCLGICAFQNKRYTEAVQAFQKAVALRPMKGDIFERLAQAYYHDNRLIQAEKTIRQALQHQPDQPSYHYCLAYILQETNRIEEAMAALRRALELNPDYPEARWRLCHLLLLSGSYSQAWKTDAWWRCDLKECPYPPDIKALAWDGMSYGGQTLLLRWERGYGDNFQCWRYLPAVKALGGTVLVEAPPEVQGLLQRHPDIDRIVTSTPDHIPPMPFDYYTTTLDLPGIFHTTVDAVPPYAPPLQAPRARVKAWGPRCTTTDFKVALVWAGDPGHGNDQQRSCDWENLTGLLQIPGVTVFSLQKGPAAEALSRAPQVVDLGSDCADFADTAGVLHHMDLVISVDTAVLHLAGTMGKPCWALLPFAPDWRWLLDREDSPWYPTIRLFRQTNRGDWAGVVQRITQELRKRISSKGGA